MTYGIGIPVKEFLTRTLLTLPAKRPSILTARVIAPVRWNMSTSTVMDAIKTCYIPILPTAMVTIAVRLHIATATIADV